MVMQNSLRDLKLEYFLISRSLEQMKHFLDVFYFCFLFSTARYENRSHRVYWSRLKRIALQLQWSWKWFVNAFVLALRLFCAPIYANTSHGRRNGICMRTEKKTHADCFYGANTHSSELSSIHLQLTFRFYTMIEIVCLHVRRIA